MAGQKSLLGGSHEFHNPATLIKIKLNRKYQYEDFQR